MQSEVWVSLLTQAPLVGIFVWAMLMVLDKMNKFQMEMMQRWDTEQRARDEVWRKFLDEQRQANNAALARMADEMRAMQESLAKHDGRVSEQMGRVVQALRVREVRS